jgi:hypothetical protein
MFLSRGGPAGRARRVGARAVMAPIVPVLVSLSLSACGSRTTLRSGAGDSEPDQVGECITDADCASPCSLQACEEGACVDVLPIACDDGDPCTEDSCDEATGCEFVSLTPDADGDGHHAALPGYLPGELGACGDDCDDTSPLALPGGFERCDGTDNDCDGIVDNGQLYLNPRIAEPLRVASPQMVSSSGAGLAYGEGVFAVSYAGDEVSSQSYLRGFSTYGGEVFPETLLTDVNVLSFGAALEWSGNAFGAAWTDPRQDGNYEVYFARFDSGGGKLGPDLRVTNAPNFSVHPDMVYDSGRFLMVWDDRRTNIDVDEAIVFGQAVDTNGNLVGENVPLSPAGIVSEYPEIAVSDRRVGVVYSALEPASGGVYLGFGSFDKNFGNAGGFVELGDGTVQGPRIAGLRDRFVVSWHLYGTEPGTAIMAAVLSDTGEILVPPQPVTFGSSLVRSHTTVSLGDRLVMVWSDYRDGNFELYAQVLGTSLEVLEAPVRVTYDVGDSVGPLAALSEDGTLGVLFDQYAGVDGHQTYFTALGCAQEIIK